MSLVEAEPFQEKCSRKWSCQTQHSKINSLILARLIPFLWLSLLFCFHIAINNVITKSWVLINRDSLLWWQRDSQAGDRRASLQHQPRGAVVFLHAIQKMDHLGWSLQRKGLIWWPTGFLLDHAWARLWFTGTTVTGRSQGLQESCGCRPQCCLWVNHGHMGTGLLAPFLQAWSSHECDGNLSPFPFPSGKGCRAPNAGQCWLGEERVGRWAQSRVRVWEPFPPHLRYSRQKIWENNKLSLPLPNWNNKEILRLISALFNEG